MIYAIFDLEFTKQEFLTEPRHYILGLQNTCFTSNLVARTIAKGAFNGLLMIMFVVNGLNGG